MTLDDAMALAVRLHRENRLDGARTLYKRILEAVPDHADALCMLGVAEHQVGHSEFAVKLLRQAVGRAPGFPGFHINLGNVLTEMNRLPDAQAAFERALELDPTLADTHNNLGAVNRAMDRFVEARACYDRALALNPGHVNAWNNLGLLLDAQGDLQGATTAYLKAIELAPGSGMSAYLLGMTFYKLGQTARATEVFRQWMLSDPDDPVPAHLYAASSGQNVPERASNHYVETEFDRFAASFERVLNERLHYRAPQLCVDLLAQHVGPPSASLDLLDAGCGTGLCGPLMAPWSRQLVGVDLSTGMLDKARNKGVYQDLVKAELTEYLQSGPDRWHAIVCADTLCYFGDLSAVIAGAASALRPGGVLVFTVEALPDDAQPNAHILPNGRYAHGRAHLDRVLAAAGLLTLQARRDDLRHEAGQPVRGWLVAAQRPA